MGFWNTTGGILWSATKLAAKGTAITTVVVGKVAAKGTVAASKAIYENRKAIGVAALETAKVTGKATVVTVKAAGIGAAYVGKKTYEHRDVIAGAGVGIAKGTAGAVADLSANIGSESAVRSQTDIIRKQGIRYAILNQRLGQKLLGRKPKAVMLDSIVVGGQTLADYIEMGSIPPEIQQAYELAYPHLASDRSFLSEIQRLDGSQLIGFASGIKGKLFEVEYVDYLNDGHLPDGYHAALAQSANNPGWDLAIHGPDGSVSEVIQLKATDSISYVQEALHMYPNIDVVTTEEVHAHLVMMGVSDHVTSAHVTDHALTVAVESGMDQAAGSMHWTPSVISLALIAFSAYNIEGLSNYQRSKSFGERSVKSYLAYIAGGGLALATGTWWIGMLGGMGSRMLLGAGRGKRDQLAQLRALVVKNEIVLKRMQGQLV